MSGELEAARVRQLERRLQHYADRLATFEGDPFLRNQVGAARGMTERTAAELEEARADLAKAQRPRHVAAADVQPGMKVANPYGGQRGRFTAAGAARVMTDGSVEIDAEDGRTGKFRPQFLLDIDWHAIDLAAQIEAEATEHEGGA
jgi:hypothetical protein